MILLRRIKPKQAIIFLGALLAILYILFQARFLVLGPQVKIESPRDGEILWSPAITVEGKASNAAWITLNGRQIFTDENGLWSEKLLVAPGVSTMTVSVRDRFGRERSKTITVFLK